MSSPSRNGAALVATLGPASVGLAAALAEAGATALRLNASHLEAGAVAAWLARLEHEAPGVPVVVDLQGAKMRVGSFPRRDVAVGDRVRFAARPSEDDELPLPHPELFPQLRPGEVLSLDDDRLRCEVERVEGEALVARWLVAGTLSPRKGLNRARHPLQLGGLSERDLGQLREAAPFGAHIAFSFITDGREVEWVRAALPGVRVVAKVERAEAVANLEQVLAAADEAWICRGDLGAQLGPRAVAEFVARFRPPRPGKPVLMAGQVLHHLASSPEPTRSEVCHLFDLLARGYAGIVLSDETAVGQAPVEAVRAARRLLDGLG